MVWWGSIRPVLFCSILAFPVCTTIFCHIRGWISAIDRRGILVDVDVIRYDTIEREFFDGYCMYSI